MMKMLFHETIRVPAERIGVIVGKNGRVKKRIQQLTNARVEVNPEGIVTISSSQESEDPVLLWKARDIIRAMARGFSPKKAFALLDEDARLIIISLREFVGTSQRQLRRVAGRIIGENGRTRRVIEQTTETKVSVYGRTVSIIGVDPGIEYARKAIDMLIEGAPHNVVYTHLEKMRRELNRQQAELWEETEL
jgi:ribosomal RNA assembly protein